MIYKNVEDMKAALMRRAADVKLVAKKVAGQAAMTLGEQLALNTPVLTGQARWNWQPTHGQPAPGPLLGEVAGVQSTGDPMTGAETQRLQDQVDDFIKSEDDVFYFTNKLPYIFRLDTGYSQKAPAGIVDISLQVTLDVLKRLVVK